MAEEASSSTSSSILDKLRPPSAYEKEVHPSGETLPEAQKVYRVNPLHAGDACMRRYKVHRMLGFVLTL